MNTDETLDRALAHHRAGRVDDAVPLYEAILEADPDHAGAWMNLGAARRQQGRAGDAVSALRRAAELAPDHPGVLYNLGNALAEAGELEAAEDRLRRATDLDPAFADAFNNWGEVLMRLGRDAAALDAFTHGSRVAPDHAGLLANRGNVEHRLGAQADAIGHLRRALELAPDDTRAWRNLGNALRTSGQLTEAEETLRAALARDPDDADAHCLLAFALFGQGKYGAGWDAYARRWSSAAHERARPFDWPEWDGADLGGRRLLVWGEQAVGDELMFATQLADLAATGAEITLETEHRLAPLFRRAFPALTVVARRDPPDRRLADGGFDCQIALGDLGRHLRREAGDFAANRPYLVADPDARAARRAHYEELAGGRRRIGVSWRSAAEQAGARRSMALTDLRPLLGLEDCWFVNLQYGDVDDELGRLESEHGVTVYRDPAIDPLTDLDGFAAGVAALDLVVSAANTTVHVAAALGLPTWVLLSATPDWRWQHGGATSPWYPTARLFRDAPGGGATAVGQAADELRKSGAGGTPG
ncbi:MAG: tetratricopeptide repeat-containing glycosyltransferase family protein [Magnetovibrio sp.]|nr:tetratricopeptide repeat-containing glycosyltransferase family protein [Magnetovibrio sp.]